MDDKSWEFDLKDEKNSGSEILEVRYQNPNYEFYKKKPTKVIRLVL
jgi:hypothetical protein